MTISPEKLASLKEIQGLIAPFDPSIMELDPCNEADAEAIALTGALLLAVKGGGSLTIVEEDKDGRTETVDIQSMGMNSGGEPVMVAHFKSSDGTFSPATADLAAELLAESHQAEVNHLVGE